MSAIRLVDGTCAGLEWIGAQNQVEYPFAACLAWAMEHWITSGVRGGTSGDGEAGTGLGGIPDAILDPGGPLSDRRWIWLP